MKKKVTSTDIAHAAGVSQSTVSMILNKKYDVSFAKETVEKVENAAKELGYVPPKRKNYQVPLHLHSSFHSGYLRSQPVSVLQSLPPDP